MIEDRIEEQEDQQELFEHFHFRVDQGQKPLRLDKFLVNRLEGMSRNRIQSAASAGNILIDGQSKKSNYRVRPGEEISIVMAFPRREVEIIPENIPITIVYEDNDVLVVNKQPGMVVHPGHGNYFGTLVNAIAFHLKDEPLFQSGEARPGLVHRIDKNTSGILVIAKNEFALQHLAKQFFDRTTDRKYIAFVWGTPAEREGTITGNIDRSVKDRKVRAVFQGTEIGKPAITHYKVVESLSYISVVECKLETGRTHQIRVHFQYFGHPVFNDDTYGGDRILKGTTFTKYKQFVYNCFTMLPRHALHAKSLAFTHPVTGKRMSFDSDLPDDMVAVLKKWRTYSTATREEF